VSLRNTLPFATIPEWLLEADVSDRAVRLYGLLVRHADQDGHAFPSRKRLSDRLKCSVDSVDRAIRELREVGAVQVRHRKDEAGDRTSNDYILRPGGRIPAATPVGISAATVAAPVRQELEPLEREPTTSVAPLRKPDPIFEALAAIEGSDLTDLTRSQRGALNKAAKELRDLGVDPKAIPRRAQAFGRRYPGATVTALALVRHWAELGGSGGPDTRPDWQVWEEALAE